MEPQAFRMHNGCTGARPLIHRRQTSCVYRASVVACLVLLLSAGKVDAKRNLADLPNIVVFLVDDQDSELGSMRYMPKTTRVFEQGGATFVNAFASSPLCCPSRSTILTGLYSHNHNVYTNNDNCSSTQWQRTFEPRSFGKYLDTAGYRTGYFGKYLNEYNGSYTPPGWHEWLGLVRNSLFYNYTVNFNGRMIRHGDNYYNDYLTDLIANDSVTFLKQSKQYFPNRPVAMVLSMPAPHGPEDAAPQYQNMFLNVTSHRTPNWNYAPNPDKVWLLQVTGKMEPIQVAFTDLLYAKRLQTLQSVDDAVEKMYNELSNLGELDNTYMIYLSDHGYHLGQFGLPKGKSLPYEFDVRIPFYIRGPGVRGGSKVKNIMGTVDVAPTILDFADIPVPDDMDGRSVKPLLNIPDEHGVVSESAMLKRRTWRDTYLLQRGKVTKKRVESYDVDFEQLPIYFTRDGQIENKCAKSKYQSPCKPGQRVECYQDSNNRMRLRKCKTFKCDCPGGIDITGSSGRLNSSSSSSTRPQPSRQYQQLVSGRQHTIEPERRSRTRTVTDTFAATEMVTASHIGSAVTDAPPRRGSGKGSRARTRPPSGSSATVASRVRRELLEVLQQPDEHRRNAVIRMRRSLEGHSQRMNRAAADGDEQAFSLQELTFMQKCQVLNATVRCSLVEEYANFKEWKKQKQALELLIQESKDHLERLKALRKNFQERYDTAKLKLSNPVPWHEQVTFNNHEQQSSSAGVTAAAASDLTGCVCREVDVDGEEPNARNRSDGLRQNPAPGVSARTAEDDAVVEEEEDETEDVDSVPAATTPSVHDGTPSRRPTSRRNRNERRGQTKVSRRNDPNCRVEGVECYVMDNSHWKVEPRWTLGPFCYCINAANNTMWCLRTINDTHNFLYCEFINGFIEYYDLNKDPWQLRNAVFDLPPGVLQQLHRVLHKLSNCKGSRECHYRYRSDLSHTASVATSVAGSAGSFPSWP